MKTCKQCFTLKSLECFYTGDRYADGYRPVCKACVSFNNTGRTTDDTIRLKQLRDERNRLREIARQRKIETMERQIASMKRTIEPRKTFLDVEPVVWTKEKLRALSSDELLKVLDAMEPEDEDDFRRLYGIRIGDDDMPYM